MSGASYRHWDLNIVSELADRLSELLFILSALHNDPYSLPHSHEKMHKYLWLLRDKETLYFTVLPWIVRLHHREEHCSFPELSTNSHEAFSITTDDSSVAVIVPSTGHLGNVEINNVEICLVFNEDVSHLAAKSANRGVKHPVHQQTAESDSMVETWFVWKLWKVFSTWKAHCIVHVEFDTWSREPEKLRQAPFLPVTSCLCFRRITANRWWEAERLQRYLHFHSMRIIILMYSQTT